MFPRERDDIPVETTHAMKTPSQEEYHHRLTEIKRHPLVAGVLRELAEKLPLHLRYHSVAHTEEVLAEAVLYALADGVSDAEIELLALAAAFHDSGFLDSPEHNEIEGARRAVRAMRAAGTYTEAQIQLVERMILDTKMNVTREGIKQVPGTELSIYLLDADLSNLGREDFFEKCELQRQEAGAEKVPFLFGTYRLLCCHYWHSKAAFDLRESRKAKNVQALERELQAIAKIPESKS